MVNGGIQLGESMKGKDICVMLGHRLKAELYQKKKMLTGGIFNAEKTCYVTSVLKLLNCLFAPVHCMNFDNAGMTELLRMRKSDIFLVQPMEMAGVQYPEAARLQMSADGVKLRDITNR